MLQDNKQQINSRDMREDQLGHPPWNRGRVGGGLEMVGLDVTGSPAVFNQYNSPGAHQVMKVDC